jgi:D-alanyl-lipoteichoic acid acyltransferase DltB (MBOAT superfamily)
MSIQHHLIYITGLILTLASSIGFLFCCRENPKVSPTARHILCCLLGITISIWTYGRGETLLIITPTVLVWILKGFAVKNQNFVKVSTAALMIWLSHWHYQATEERGGSKVYRVTFTTSLMLVVSRLTMVLGDLSVKRISLAQCSFWRFFGYTLGFGTFLAGPIMPISTYLSVVENSSGGNAHPKGQSSNGDDSKGRDSKASVAFKGDNSTSQASYSVVSKREILYNGLWLIAQSALLGALHVLTALIWKPAKLISPEFALASCWSKAFWIWGAAFSRRLQYYFAWRFAEGCSTFIGFTQEHSTSSIQQPNVRIIKVLACEFATSPKEFLDNWHISTSRWLYDYIYIASAAEGQKPGVYSTLLTNFVSAYWHGTNFGYYLTFGSVGFNVLAMRQIRRKAWHLILKVPAPVRKVLGVLMTQFFVSGFLGPFLLLGRREVMHFQRQIFWLPQLVTLGILVVASVL